MDISQTWGNGACLDRTSCAAQTSWVEGAVSMIYDLMILVCMALKIKVILCIFFNYGANSHFWLCCLIEDPITDRLSVIFRNWRLCHEPSAQPTWETI